MNTIATSLPRALIGLVVILFAQPVWSDSADESWGQVFNFQLKLAEQGNVKAQYILGEMYEQGRGAEKNLDTAILWYRKAEKSGHKKATTRIAAIQENLRLTALGQAEAAAEKQRQEEEKARQAVLQKQRVAEEQLRQQALAKAQTATPAPRKVDPAPPQEDDTRLSPDERAQKIKEAQERAVEIAKLNALRQQQEADAELRKYRASIQPQPAKPSKTNKGSAKFQDAFE